MVELYIGAYRIDLKEDVELSLNLSIADIRNPETRQQSYSKTIKAVGSGNNAKAFEYIFEIDITGGYNPKLKRDARLVVDGEVRMEGYAQLKQILRNDTEIVYELVIIGELSTLYGELGQTYIHELDFSDLDHDLLTSNQIASWTATQGEGYYYPMIDYGQTSNRLTWKAIDLYPAVYVKEYIDRMFALAGKTYDSAFFDSAFFKSLIIPFNRNRLELDKTQILDRTFKATRQFSAQNITLGSTTTLLFNDETHDAGGVYNTGTGVFTVGHTGYYNISCVAYSRLSVSVTSPAGGGVVYLPTHTVRIFPRIRSDSGVFVTGSQRFVTVDQPFAATYITATDPTYPDADYPNLVNPPNAVKVEAVNVFLTAGETYEIEWAATLEQIPTAPITGTPQFYRTDTNALAAGSYGLGMLQGSFYKVDVANVMLMEGDEVIMAQAIPLNIKCTDFLTSIIRMFNVYIEVDRSNSNNYLIEPFNTFFSNEINDWSKLIDRDSEVEIMPVGTLDVGEFLFTYKTDSDYFNSQYTQVWGEVYGEISVDAETDFYKQEKKTELIFSPTPISDGDTGEMPLSTIYKTDNNNVVQPYGGNIRILIAGGLKDAPTVWTLVNTGVQAQYPYAGHLDDPYIPTVDINFGVVRQVYYRNAQNEIVWNYDNLYNVYYSKFISEIIHPDSKIVTAYFNLTKLIEGEIDFRKLYYFNDQYFRLQKVYDYNPLVPSLTKCEFLKLNEGVAFTNADVQIVGAYDDGGVVITPALPSGFFPNDNNMSSISVRRGLNVTGSGNYIDRSASNITIVGDNNRVNADSLNVSIIGSGNWIDPNLKGVVLINTNNLTVTEAGYYVGGVKVVQPKVYRGIMTQVSTNAPTVAVMENTLGTIAWTRVTDGQYRGTLVGAFAENKTHVLMSGYEDALIYGFRNNANIVNVFSQVSDSLVYTDGLITNVSIQILVYP